MNDAELGELIYDNWIKADKAVQKSLLRYTLRHCGLSVLMDLWCYFNGIG